MTTQFNFSDDFGADPTGVSTSDDALAAVSGYTGPIECIVPDGTYRFSGTEHTLAGVETTFRAKRGSNPTFVAPEDYADAWLTIVGEITVQGFEIDQSNTGAAPQLSIQTESAATLADITVTGQAADSGGSLVTADAKKPNAVVTLSNLAVEDGAGTDGIHRQDGVSVPSTSVGTVRLEDCSLQELPGYGVDVGEAGGDIKINGGTYADNGIAQIRCGSGKTTMKDTTCLVDPDNATVDSVEGHFVDTDGILIDSEAPRTESETTIQDSRLRVQSGDDSTVGSALFATDRGGAITIRDTVCEQDVNGIPAIRCERPGALISDDAPTVCSDVRCIGRATSGAAVVVRGRPVTLRGCAIDTPNARRAMDLPSTATVQDVETGARTW